MSKIIITSIFSLLFICLKGQYTLDTSLPCVGMKFNVSVNVVLDGEGNSNLTLDKIEEDLKAAQACFAPICLEFNLCRLDTIENYAFDTLNVIRRSKIYEHFNKDHMLNITYAQFSGFVSERHLAPLGGILEPNRAHVIMSKDGTGKDLCHLLGHVFGLRDTFEGNELVDGSNCLSEGDLLCSTPADPYNFDPNVPWVDQDCVFVYNIKDDNDDSYQPQVANMMSQYNDCRISFNREQFDIIVENLLNLDYKLW